MGGKEAYNINIYNYTIVRLGSGHKVIQAAAAGLKVLQQVTHHGRQRGLQHKQLLLDLEVATRLSRLRLRASKYSNRSPIMGGKEAYNINIYNYTIVRLGSGHKVIQAAAAGLKVLQQVTHHGRQRGLQHKQLLLDLEVATRLSRLRLRASKYSNRSPIMGGKEAYNINNYC